jgi:ferritin-like metal-binding protein YciE
MENHMKLESLHDLYVDELRDLYSAEAQLIKAIPKMAKAASSPELRGGFEAHWKQTQKHATRLEQILKKLNANPKGKKCKAMEGLLEEGKKIMEEDAEPAVMDAALIAAAQKVEHYEIASYGTVCTWAELLGQTQALHLLEQTLEEEKETDAELSQLAKETINELAAESA